MREKPPPRDAEPALRESHETLQWSRLLSDQARDILLLRREDGRILEANRAAVEAYGYPLERLLLSTVRDITARRTADAKRDMARERQMEGRLRQAQKMEAAGRLAAGWRTTSTTS